MTNDMNDEDEIPEVSYSSELDANLLVQLQKEIDYFNNSSKVRTKIKREIQESGEHRTSIDAYQDWLDTHDGKEIPKANPDTLSDEDMLSYITKPIDRDTTKFLKEAREVMSDKELQVWDLIMKEQVNHRDAATQLGISKRSLQTLLKRASKKFRNTMEAIKRVEKE